MGECARPAKRRRHLLPALLVAGLSVSALTPALAQEGGVLLTFGIDQGLRSESNPGLATPAAATRQTARTTLSFGAVTETRSQRLAFSAQGVLVTGDGATDGLAEPSASLSYQRESVNSLLRLTASLREQEVDALDFFLDTDETDAVIITAVAGTGTQRRIGYGAFLEFGREAPFGGSLSINRAETEYTGTTDPTLIDSTRDTLRLSLRFALSEATEITATASQSRLDEVGAAATSTTDSLSLGLAHDLPNGQLTAEASLTDTAAGQRESLSIGRSFDLARGQLTARLGLSSQATGGSALTGSLAWAQDLPNGKLSFNLTRSVTGDARDSETRLTRLNIGYSRDLSPRLTGSLNMGLQDSQDTATATRTRTTNLSANLVYALTEDWGLDLGATHRIRDRDASPRADSTTFTLSLRRTFEFRP